MSESAHHSKGVVQKGVDRIRWFGRGVGRVVWDNDDKSDEERRFVRKLDCLLMSIACLGYFVKYLSQANISNAYASGMKEALHFQGNQYNVLLTMFTVGYVIGQFPGTLLTVRISPSIWLPTCEVIWTVLVMLCTVAKNVQTLYALRFLIGLLEASAYPGMLWVLGSWYGPAELGKRVVIFQATSSIGTMFSGYLQTAVHKGLEGAHGLHGYQWLFIMDGVICLPIAIAGYFCIPDTPSKINPRCRWYLTDHDIEMALARTHKWRRAPTKGFTLQVFKDVSKTWIPWVFFWPYTAFVIGLGSYQYMNLWLKATPGYNSISQINLIPTGGYGLSVVMSLVWSWVSDTLNTRWPVLIAGGIPPLVGNIILATWPASNRLNFAGFFLNFTATPIGAIMLAWCNELLSESAEARAITIGFLNTAAYVFNAWAPNLIFPASQAPHYKAGYKVTSVFFGIWIIGVLVIMLLMRAYPTRTFKNEYDEQEAEAPEKKLDDDEAPVTVANAATLVEVDGRATSQAA